MRWAQLLQHGGTHGVLREVSVIPPKTSEPMATIRITHVACHWWSPPISWLQIPAKTMTNGQMVGFCFNKMLLLAKVGGFAGEKIIRIARYRCLSFLQQRRSNQWHEKYVFKIKPRFWPSDVQFHHISATLCYIMRFSISGFKKLNAFHQRSCFVPRADSMQRIARQPMLSKSETFVYRFPKHWLSMWEQGYLAHIVLCTYHLQCKALLSIARHLRKHEQAQQKSLRSFRGIVPSLLHTVQWQSANALFHSKQ